MSSTRYARDRTLRLDTADAGTLARSVMSSIAALSAEQQQCEPGPRREYLSGEVRTLRSLLERLSD